MAVHIAILDVEVPLPSFYAVHGLMSSRFRTLLEKAAARVNPSVSIHTTAYDVVGGNLPPVELLAPRRPPGKPDSSRRDHDHSLFHHIDGILITGSTRSAYEIAQVPWIARLQAFIQTVHTQHPH